jgi:hypothetical protein
VKGFIGIHGDRFMRAVSMSNWDRSRFGEQTTNLRV